MGAWPGLSAVCIWTKLKKLMDLSNVDQSAQMSTWLKPHNESFKIIFF
jgi:hypothetical protein